jgi:hypothetical protein
MTDVTEKLIEEKIKEAVTAVMQEVRKAQEPEKPEIVRKAFSGTVDAQVLTQIQRVATLLGMNYYEAYEEAFRLFLRASRMSAEQSTDPFPNMPGLRS